jgi:very-short-patch-repair endonuclease
MVNCSLCDKRFKNNLGGQLTIHIEHAHNMSFEDYIVLTEYDGIQPSCACGLCDLPPLFYRGKFNRYAPFHNKSEIKKKLWLEKYGSPVCKICGKNTKFYRGEPREFCSKKCAAKSGNGFCNPSVQEKIKEIVFNRYGVHNVSHVEYVKNKISKALSGRFVGRKINDDTKRKISTSLSIMWKDEQYKIETSKKIKDAINSNDEELIRRSNFMKKMRENPEFNRKNFLGCKNRLTKLHKKIRAILKLDELGFESEKNIDRYFVDEFNESHGIILEIFGDYAHANPRKYKKNDMIRLYGQAYTAEEKWIKDNVRTKKLESLGYKVIIVWESDDLKEKYIEIKKMFE